MPERKIRTFRSVGTSPQAVSAANREAALKPTTEQLFATVDAGSKRCGTNNLQRPAPLAQLVEQLTLNQWVPGSSP